MRRVATAWGRRMSLVFLGIGGLFDLRTNTITGTSNRWPGRIGLLALMVLTIGTSVAGRTDAQITELDRARVFDEIWTLAQQHFHEPAAVGASWQQARESFRARAMAARTQLEFAAVMNELLATLKTSHTYYFAVPNQRRAQLLGVFQGLVPRDREDLIFYESIGVEVERIADKTFVRAVYDGCPAAKAGLLYGDEILSVDGAAFQEIDSFRGKQAVQIQYRRHADEAPRNLEVQVAKLDGRTLFEEALMASARVIEARDKKIAYVHVWSYAGSKYQDLLRNLLLYDQLKGADGLVLDLREGWGGASLEYLNLFRQPIAEVTSRSRDGEPSNFSGTWNKPVALLVNRRTTSGKEMFTFGFKKLGLGPVVGETTAGAVVAGRGFLLSNHDVLYLAVADIRIDGQRLEGSGVEPTVAVDRPLPYAAGADPPLDRAVELLVKEAD